MSGLASKRDSPVTTVPINRIPLGETRSCASASLTMMSSRRPTPRVSGALAGGLGGDPRRFVVPLRAITVPQPLCLPQNQWGRHLACHRISGVGILPAIESTLGNRKLEAYATL